jgi:glycosidase
MLLTSPGVPFIYYGEEIGMLGQKPDERIRTPMQWTAGASAGFTASTAPWEPVNVDSSAKNVAAQVGDPGSLLAWYRALISVRNAHAALRVGDTYVLEAGHPALYGLLRISEDEAALVLINLGKDVVSDYNLSLASGPLAGRYRMAPVLGGAPAIELSASAQGGLQSYRPLAEIPPYSAFIWQLQPAR